MPVVINQFEVESTPAAAPPAGPAPAQSGQSGLSPQQMQEIRRIKRQDARRYLRVRTY